MSESVGKGPALFENWRAALQSREVVGAYECPLYSDAPIVGEVEIGPYQLINTIAQAGSPPGVIAPVVVLRVAFHTAFEPPRMDKTDTGTYHGGTLSDEIAAITSLALGCRVKAGPTSREFYTEDPRGRPVAHDGFAPPVLPRGNRGRILPWATTTRDLNNLGWFSDWFEASPKDQIALVRAARLYQDAIWLADAEPALAWLMFVSAIETAAARSSQTKATAVERLRCSKPDLTETIESTCPELLEVIAKTFADTTKATQKFVDFVLRFLPAPPEIRPEEAFQIIWNEEHMRLSLTKIYDYRSKALHTGVPFPAPMCEPPMRIGSSNIPPERSPGLATSTRGGTWTQKDTPMALHIFEYISRMVLRGWWSFLRTAQ